MKIIASWNYWKGTGHYPEGTKRRNDPSFEALTGEGAVFTGHRAGIYTAAKLLLVPIESEAFVLSQHNNLGWQRSRKRTCRKCRVSEAT